MNDVTSKIDFPESTLIKFYLMAFEKRILRILVIHVSSRVVEVQKLRYRYFRCRNFRLVQLPVLEICYGVTSGTWKFYGATSGSEIFFLLQFPLTKFFLVQLPVLDNFSCNFRFTNFFFVQQLLVHKIFGVQLPTPEIFSASTSGAPVVHPVQLK